MDMTNMLIGGWIDLTTKYDFLISMCGQQALYYNIHKLTTHYTVCEQVQAESSYSHLCVHEAYTCVILFNK